MQYERSITSGLEVMAKVKVFVHATDADADADDMPIPLAPRTYLSSKIGWSKSCQKTTTLDKSLLFLVQQHPYSGLFFC